MRVLTTSASSLRASAVYLQVERAVAARLPGSRHRYPWAGALSPLAADLSRLLVPLRPLYINDRKGSPVLTTIGDYDHLCTGDLPYPEMDDDFTALRPAPTRGTYRPLPATAPAPAPPEQP